MPVDPTHAMPKDKEMIPIPPDMYTVEVGDCEYEIKPSPFKKADGTPQEDTRQYKLKLIVLDADEYRGRTLLAWVRESLVPSSKAKNPCLPEFLLAVTGQVFTAADFGKVTGEFMNSLIGSQLRVSTKTGLGPSRGPILGCFLTHPDATMRSGKH